MVPFDFFYLIFFSRMLNLNDFFPFTSLKNNAESLILKLKFKH